MLRTFCLAVWVIFLGPLALGQSVPILSLTFEGNKVIDSTRLKAQLRTSREGAWYRAQSLSFELQQLANFYREEGFLKAEIGDPAVELREVPGKGQAAVIRVRISEGPRYMLGELVIKNAQALKPSSMIHMSPMRTGEPYSRSKLAAWRTKIEDAYQSMGYVRAEISIKEEIHDFRRVVDCTVECAEGSLYKVGNINVTGDDSINPLEFRKRLLLGKGSAYNPEMLSLSLQFINSLRLYRPVSESDVTIQVDDATSTVDLTFRVVSLRKPSSD
jgi:outer membrane protein insertion porin family